MKRATRICAAIAAAAASPAFAQGMPDVPRELSNYLIVDGISAVVYAQERCGFPIDTDALTRFLDERGLLAPDVMSVISTNVELARAGEEEVSPTQCQMHKATAAKMGVLAN